MSPNDNDRHAATMPARESNDVITVPSAHFQWDIFTFSEQVRVFLTHTEQLARPCEF
jgi:hypothetical protein